MDSDVTTRLLLRAREGSPEALDALYGRCAPRLLALIRLKLGPTLRARLESRDILQSTLLRSFRAIPELEAGDRDSLMAWLARIAENEIRDRADHHRRQRRDAGREVPLDARVESLRAPVRSLSSRVALDEKALRLEAALERLAEDHRRVIVLRKLEELSWREVARRMHRGEDACRMLLARAMKALTLEMEAAK